MKYVAPFAELVALETVNVLLTSEEESSCNWDNPSCPNEVPCANDEWA